MVIAGGGGHAKEILGTFLEMKFEGVIHFFDDVTETALNGAPGRYKRLKTLNEAAEIFSSDPAFVLGIGKPQVRKQLADRLTSVGGKLESVISPYARIGSDLVYDVAGLNIMTGAVITLDVTIGTGSLVHINSSVHHDCIIGEYCELSPGCCVLGKVSIGDYTSVGAGAIILPGITVGKNVVIGAGAVVTKNISDGRTVKGVPAC